MKSALFLLVICLAASACRQLEATQAKTDSRQVGFVGSIKSLSIERAVGDARVLTSSISFDPSGQITQESLYVGDGSLRAKMVYSLDNAGKKIEGIIYAPNDSIRGKKIFKYDDKGNTSEVQTLREDGTIYSRDVYSYDERNNPAEWIQINPRGAQVDKWSYTYDDKGRKIKEARYYADDSLDFTLIHVYYDNGNLKRSEKYKADGKLLAIEQCDYEIDSKGNWTKKTLTRQPANSNQPDADEVEITYRSITYY